MLKENRAKGKTENSEKKEGKLGLAECSFKTPFMIARQVKSNTCTPRNGEPLVAATQVIKDNNHKFYF